MIRGAFPPLDVQPVSVSASVIHQHELVINSGSGEILDISYPHLSALLIQNRKIKTGVFCSALKEKKRKKREHFSHTTIVFKYIYIDIT